MAWNQAPVVVTTLANGVKVATKETFAETASVGVYVDAGVRDESLETRGATAVLEQLTLTGTATRPRAKLESDIESIGATLDLSYGREHSSFNMTVFKSDLAQGVDILSDMVTKPALANYAKEKANILRKLEETEQDTRKVIDDRLHACAFRDYSLGFSTVGPFENIDSLSQEHLKKHVESNFTADKMVLAASGAVKHADLVKLAEKAFGGVKAGAPKSYSTKPYFCGAQLLYRNDEMGPLAYISTAWEAVPYKSPDAVTFMVMQAIIGKYKKNVGLVPGNISGNRCVNAVANKMGVGCAEEYEAFIQFYKDTGLFGFYIVCDEVAVEHAIGELMFNINLLSFSVTDEEGVESYAGEWFGKHPGKLQPGWKGSADLWPRCATSRDDASNRGRGCRRGETSGIQVPQRPGDLCDGAGTAARHAGALHLAAGDADGSILVGSA